MCKKPLSKYMVRSIIAAEGKGGSTKFNPEIISPAKIPYKTPMTDVKGKYFLVSSVRMSSLMGIIVNRAKSDFKPFIGPI